MKATLGTRIHLGNLCLICPRCGWWQAHVEPFKPDLDRSTCPDCHCPIDAVEPTRPPTKT